MTVPSEVPSGIIAIAVGERHTVALESNGSVVAWGWNIYGQTTVPAVAQSGVTAIAVGEHHTVALKQDGRVVAWGRNEYGQATVPSEAQSGVIAIAAGGYHTVALKSNGSVVAWGWNIYDQTTVPSEAQSGVTSIAAGVYHTVALKSNGSVIAWGWNNSGQTTIPSEAQSGVIAIAAGGHHTVALKQDGSVVAWGNNSFGQTAVPSEAQSGVTILAAGTYHTVALKQEGSVVAWGRNNYGQTTVPSEAQSGVTSIAAGGNATFHRLSVGLAVEEPAGRTLPSGSGLSFGGAMIGGSAPAKILIVRNSGTEPVTIYGVSLEGENPAEFQIDDSSLSATIPPGGSGSFGVTFIPRGTESGGRNAVLHISSNDAANGNYAIPLEGLALSMSADTDGDGLNDWAEYLYSSLGLDWEIAQPALVETLHAGANGAGLYTQSQIQALNVGTPLLTKNPATNEFTLTLGLGKSTNLSGFQPFPVSVPQVTVTGDGKLEIRFTSSEPAAFFRVEAK